eukprot:ANDGO_02181.mRNA.1 hypothetical protein
MEKKDMDSASGDVSVPPSAPASTHASVPVPAVGVERWNYVRSQWLAKCRPMQSSPFGFPTFQHSRTVSAATSGGSSFRDSSDSDDPSDTCPTSHFSSFSSSAAPSSSAVESPPSFGDVSQTPTAGTTPALALVSSVQPHDGSTGSELWISADDRAVEPAGSRVSSQQQHAEAHSPSKLKGIPPGKVRVSEVNLDEVCRALVSSENPQFKARINLADMVGLLMELWEAEGLFD